MYDSLIASIERSPVVDRNGYPYFVHPLTDGVPPMDPAVLREVLDWMLRVGNFDCDVIVPLALELGKPYVVIRKKKYGLPGEVALEQQTGYSKSTMYINGIRPGMRVTVVDDVVSTGGTMIALIRALTETVGAKITDIVIPVDKGDGENLVEKATGLRIKSLVRVKIADNRAVCTLC